MKIIQCLSEKIEEEIDDAGAYIDLAMKWKAEEPEPAELFYQLSTEEMGHVEKLHKAVADLIALYRNRTGDPPREMAVLYDYLHKKHIAAATQVKIRQGMFKAD